MMRRRAGLPILFLWLLGPAAVRAGDFWIEPCWSLRPSFETYVNLPGEPGDKLKSECPSSRIALPDSFATDETPGPVCFNRKDHEERMRCCAAGKADYCLAAGVTMLNPYQHPADPREARRLLASGCELENASACRLLAVMERDGTGGPRDAAASAHHLESSCKHGDDRGCVLLADSRTKADPAAALRLYQDACKQGNLEGCLRGGERELAMLPAGAPAARVLRARNALMKDARDWPGSAVLAVVYHDGIGVAPDPAFGKRFLHVPDPLADYLERWEKAAKEESGATTVAWLPLLRTKCEERAAFGCYWMAELAKGDVIPGLEPAQAPMYFKQACTFGSGAACDEYHSK